MTDERTSPARRPPLGAYFRVNHKDLIAMHSAIAEVGVLYATAAVHDGWNRVGTDVFIKQSDMMIGGHAFAIVAFDAEGFWIQNSWGEEWGHRRLCPLSYDDWLDNGSDAWVARLGARLYGPELHAWCREKGLFEHQLVQWRAAFCAAAQPAPAIAAEQRQANAALRELQGRHDKLKQEIHRKDRALAEAAALLVLQKKFQAMVLQQSEEEDK